MPRPTPTPPGPGQESVWDFPRPPALGARRRDGPRRVRGPRDRPHRPRAPGQGDEPPADGIRPPGGRGGGRAPATPRDVGVRVEGARRLLRTSLAGGAVAEKAAWAYPEPRERLRGAPGPRLVLPRAHGRLLDRRRPPSSRSRAGSTAGGSRRGVVGPFKGGAGHVGVVEGPRRGATPPPAGAEREGSQPAPPGGGAGRHGVGVLRRPFPCPPPPPRMASPGPRPAARLADFPLPTLRRGLVTGVLLAVVGVLFVAMGAQGAARGVPGPRHRYVPPAGVLLAGGAAGAAGPVRDPHAGALYRPGPGRPRVRVRRGPATRPSTWVITRPRWRPQIQASIDRLPLLSADLQATIEERPGPGRRAGDGRARRRPGRDRGVSPSPWPCSCSRRSTCSRRARRSSGTSGARCRPGTAGSPSSSSTPRAGSSTGPSTPRSSRSR